MSVREVPTMQLRWVRRCADAVAGFMDTPARKLQQQWEIWDEEPQVDESQGKLTMPTSRYEWRDVPEAEAE